MHLSRLDQRKSIYFQENEKSQVDAQPAGGSISTRSDGVVLSQGKACNELSPNHEGETLFSEKFPCFSENDKILGEEGQRKDLIMAGKFEISDERQIQSDRQVEKEEDWVNTSSKFSVDVDKEDEYVVNEEGDLSASVQPSSSNVREQNSSSAESSRLIESGSQPRGKDNTSKIQLASVVEQKKKGPSIKQKRGDVHQVSNGNKQQQTACKPAHLRARDFIPISTQHSWNMRDTCQFCRESHVMYIMRGVPGTGKSTIAENIARLYPRNAAEICSADDFR